MPEDAIKVTERGYELLRNPHLNKGTAFSEEERRELGLDGLLPPAINSLQQQMLRVMENVRAEASDLERYNYLRLLQDRNETLFHAVLMENLVALAPIVYTPTVGEACRRFSHIFRTARGLHITPENIDRIDQMLTGAAEDEVGIIVCTDNEGILGIGDQGVGGIGIPIGKLALYVAAGGFAPTHCLPVSLDVGTDNEALLRDPLYIGMRRRRLADQEYEQFIAAFVEGVRRNCPRAVLQWEDFSRERAWGNLERYRDVLPSFNDDIQGTASVALAGLLGALRKAGRELADEQVCIVGAGAAGVGVARGIMAALVGEGMSEEQARGRVHVFDSQGLVMSDRGDLEDYKLGVAGDPEQVRAWGLSAQRPSVQQVIEAVRPGVLIGLSGHSGAVTREMVQAISAGCDAPIIFVLSNPSGNVEAHPHDVVAWSQGRAIVASGSPFEPLEYQGRIHRFSQVNNFYVFPGIGAGAHLAGARRITDRMLVAAAMAVHEALEDRDLEAGLVLPPPHELRQVAVRVAAAIMRACDGESLCRLDLPQDTEDAVRRWQYIPRYRRYLPG